MRACSPTSTGVPKRRGANEGDELRSVPLDRSALREAPLPEDITVTVRDLEAFSGAGTYGYITL